ncbi:MAG: hypothetical protein IPH82_27710 [Chloroflexi bacterium]|nr:hypothetical protein [Chloroflexota bacterium]
MNERQAAESRLGEGWIARISNLEGAAAGGDCLDLDGMTCWLFCRPAFSVQ